MQDEIGSTTDHETDVSSTSGTDEIDSCSSSTDDTDDETCIKIVKTPAAPKAEEFHSHDQSFVDRLKETLSNRTGNLDKKSSTFHETIYRLLPIKLPEKKKPSLKLSFRKKQINPRKNK